MPKSMLRIFCWYSHEKHEVTIIINLPLLLSYELDSIKFNVNISWVSDASGCRSSHLGVFCKKCFLKNFAFHRKAPVPESLF